MDRRVVRDIIDNWIDKNGPNGLLKLAERSGVSSSTIVNARLGMAPRKHRTRDQLCKALGVREDALFPPVKAERAS